MSNVKVKVKISGNLKELRDKLHERAQSLIVDALNEGIETSQEYLGYAQAYENDNEDANLEWDVKDLKGTISLVGSQALFVEYGAGDMTIPPHTPGDYSKSHAQQYSKHGYWFWNDEIHFGYPAYRPIYEARKTVERYLEEHAAETLSGIGEE